MTAWLIRNLHWCLTAALLAFIAVVFGDAILSADQDLLWP